VAGFIQNSAGGITRLEAAVGTSMPHGGFKSELQKDK
jgi:hypothetical protein